MNYRLKAECERAKRGGKAQKDTMTMEQIEARPATPPTVRRLEHSPARRSCAASWLTLSTGDARPTPALRAAKVIADKAEALMCAAGEKVVYGGHRSRLSRARPLRPKSRRKGEARLGPCVERLQAVKDISQVAALVVAAMCPAFACGSHDRWP